MFLGVDTGDAQRVMNTHLARMGVRALLWLAGEDPDRPGLVDTPRRVVDAWLEMTARPGDPAELLARTFDDVGEVEGMVRVGPVRFVSVCEHHLLPFTGVVHLGYVPVPGKVVGLSKLPRLVDHYARRPQVQERLTRQLADAVMLHLDADGVAVRVEGVHACTVLRGARCAGAAMVTAVHRGALAGDPLRGEFAAWAERGGT